MLFIEKTLARLFLECDPLDVPQFSTCVEIAWTADFAKVGFTFSGFQLLGFNTNPDSPLNYCLSAIYHEIDSTGYLKSNCDNALSWINAHSPLRSTLIALHDRKIKVTFLPTVLLDLAAYEHLLCYSGLCFFCDLGVTCAHKSITMHNVTMEWYESYDLRLDISVFHPESLVLNIPLFHLHLDWPLHGYKRLINNFLLAVYLSWRGGRTEANQDKMENEEAEFNAAMRTVRKSYKGILK
jgi:hypothetical protein